MLISIVGIDLSYKQMETLTCVAPAVFTVKQSLPFDLNQCRLEIVQKIAGCSRISLQGTGRACAAVSSVYSSRCQFEIAVFGEYIPAVIDIKEILEGYVSQGLEYSVAISDEEETPPVNKAYYLLHDVSMLDRFSYNASSADTLYAALEKMVEWTYTDGAKPCSQMKPHELYRNTLLSNNIAEDDEFMADNWSAPAVDLPAIVIMYLLTYLGKMRVCDVNMSSDGAIEVAVSFEECDKVYSRQLILDALEAIDELLYSEVPPEIIPWDEMAYKIADDLKL